MRFLRYVLTLLLLIPVTASADLISGLWGLGSYNMPRSSGNTGGPGGGGGLTFEFRGKTLGFETGVLYQGQVLNGSNLQYLNVPLALRYWWSTGLTASFGGYFKYLINPMPSVDSSDYGARVTLGYDWPMGQQKEISFAVECGYQFSLSSPKVGVQQDQVFFLIGFRFGRSTTPINRSDPLPSLPYTPAN